MSLILDGYNVLFAIAEQRGRSVAEAIEAARETLLRHLLRHHRQTGEATVIIFDSRHGTGGARTQQTLPGIRIFYSHPPRTADDDIRRLVETSTAPKQLRVVSSDRQLAADCARRGASVVGARTFFNALLQEARSTSKEEEESRIKTQPPSDEEVRDWLKIFGNDPKE